MMRGRFEIDEYQFWYDDDCLYVKAPDGYMGRAPHEGWTEDRMREAASMMLMRGPLSKQMVSGRWDSHGVWYNDYAMSGSPVPLRPTQVGGGGPPPTPRLLQLTVRAYPAGFTLMDGDDKIIAIAETAERFREQLITVFNTWTAGGTE